MISRELIDTMKNLGVFPAVLSTVDKDGNIHLVFITWVHPVDDRTLRFALSSNAKSAKNILETGRASLMVFNTNMALALYGRAKIVLERIEEVKFPVSVFELSLERVEDTLFPGGTVTGPIPFAHTGDLVKASELDELVLSALRK
ncbi:pyridoxamine 5'-phosphate oxidase family protein [Thermocrinis sp.]|uniref:pyridoxamine 5'-phosphate oxidase family protein n=1 Tax=Thermocrinis sp. TaxID=2024383 RepID=UPI002FDD0B33